MGCMRKWIYKWASNGWINSKGNEVANRDLIKEASDLDDRAKKLGDVKFVWIPRSENHLADKLCNLELDDMED
jgi:ribonuclease HI